MNDALNVPRNQSPPVTDEPHVQEIHLLLSGGGYRATLFHLGVLRYLYEHKVCSGTKSLLSMVTEVIGVSGGSITAAHFALFRDDYLANFRHPATRLLDFCSSVDLRRSVLTDDQAAAEGFKKLYQDKTF